jgi:hypothetical protein
MMIPFGVAVAGALMVGMAVGIVVILFLVRPPAPSENEVLHARLDSLTNECHEGFDKLHDALSILAADASRIEHKVEREAVTQDG